MFSQRNLRSWDQLLIWLSLAGIVLLAWVYLVWSNSLMVDGTMAGMRRWSVNDYFATFAMWSIMMVGMMVPTSVRAIRIYMMVSIQAQRSQRRITSSYWFVLGYLIVWLGFSATATLLQGFLTSIGLVSSMMVSTSPALGALILIVAGLYQLTPWKESCLRQCQSPAEFLAGGFGPRPIHGIRLGIGHGLYCLGCCWGLMLLLFVGGIMNLLWIAAITAFVLMEKLLPMKSRLTQGSAVLMILGGIAYFVVTS